MIFFGYCIRFVRTFSQIAYISAHTTTIIPKSAVPLLLHKKFRQKFDPDSLSTPSFRKTSVDLPSLLAIAEEARQTHFLTKRINLIQNIMKKGAFLSRGIFICSLCVSVLCSVYVFELFNVLTAGLSTIDN